MKKIVLGAILLTGGVSVMAMDHIQERPVLQEASHHEEESRVKIRLTDSQDPKIPHEVEIPVHLAKLIGALNELVEDPRLHPVWPLPNVTFVQWQFIEPQLERVYGITHDASQAAQLREAIMIDFRKLDVKSLVGVICASDYLEIPLLLESACKVLEQSTLDKILWEELEVLPRHIGNQIIMHKVVRLLGPVPAKELPLCLCHEGPVNSVCVTQDGKIFSGSYDAKVSIGDIEGNQLAVCRGHERAVTSVCITKDGKIVSGSWDNTVRVWDMQSNQLAVCGGDYEQDEAMSVCVTKDGKIVSACSGDNMVRVWDMEGNELAVCRGHEGSVTSVCVTQDGKIFSGSYDNTVRVWDMQGNQLAVCRGHEGIIESVCVTEYGKIVSCSEDKTVRVWDMEGNELAVCRGHEGDVNSVCVTRDSKIVSGSYDGTVRVWDMQSNQLAVCRGHENWVDSVCITNDGKIVSGSRDKTVRVWDMEGNQLAVCRGHEGGVYAVCLAHDGKIVSGSGDTTVLLWDIGLLDRIVYMDEDQARALWAYVRILPHNVDQQTCWYQIEKILGEDAPVEQANVNNNDNE